MFYCARRDHGNAPDFSEQKNRAFLLAVETQAAYSDIN
jgi:hypothetical protein